MNAYGRCHNPTFLKNLYEYTLIFEMCNSPFTYCRQPEIPVVFYSTLGIVLEILIVGLDMAFTGSAVYDVFLMLFYTENFIVNKISTASHLGACTVM